MVKRKGNQNKFIYLEKAKKLKTHLILALMCFLNFRLISPWNLSVFQQRIQGAEGAMAPLPVL